MRKRPEDDILAEFADEPKLTARPVAEHKGQTFAEFVDEGPDITAPADYKAAVYGGDWAEAGDEPQAQQAADLLLAQIGNGEFPQSWNELREHLIGAIAVYQTIVGGPVGDNYNGMLLEGLFLQYGPKWIEAHVAQLLRKFPTYRKG